MSAAIVALRTSEVEFVKELYPRLREDEAAIERYRAAIDRLPPIAVARGRILVDGFHRWQAHRREGVENIEAEDLGNLADAEILRESIERNAAHGQQLSARDKQRLAGQLWLTLGHLPSSERYTDLTSLLSVSERTIQAWTKDARRVEKDEQKARAWDLWLDCKSEHEIAEEIGTPRTTVQTWLDEKRDSADFVKAPESRQHFDLWSFQNASGDSGYFGRMPPQVVENLLWLYTEPGGTVVDLFAGGGTTIDVAKAMGRRVWASDRKPSTPTLPIHEYDATRGWPEAAPRKADFVLLDPPYWMQAAGRYSDDGADLANQTLDDFLSSWERVIEGCRGHLSEGGKLAFVVSPARDEQKDVVDLAFAMYGIASSAGLRQHRRIIVPYQTQQASAQQVEWARSRRDLLVLYRDLVVMECA